MSENHIRNRDSDQTFSDLALAVGQAKAGDTLILDHGLYQLHGRVPVHFPLTIEAAPGARPVLQNLDTTVGDIFENTASLSLRGLTLSHEMVAPDGGRPLVYASAPLVLEDCRLEKLWKQSPSLASLQSVVSTSESVAVRRSVIDASASVGFYLRNTGQKDPAELRMESCAMSAVRAFYLHSTKGPRQWNVEIGGSRILSGAFFCFQESNLSSVSWDISKSVIVSPSMFMVRGPFQDFAEGLLPRLSWRGKDNLYRTRRFIYPWEGGPEGTAQLASLEGWLELCPDSTDNSSETDEAIFVDVLPLGYREMRNYLRNQPPLDISHLALPESLAAFPSEMPPIGPR